MVELLLEDGVGGVGRNQDRRHPDAESVESVFLLMMVGRQGRRWLHMVVKTAMLVEHDDKQACPPQLLVGAERVVDG